MNEFWINPLGLDDKTTVVDGHDGADYMKTVPTTIKVALRQLQALKKCLITKFFVDPDSLKSNKNKLIRVDADAIKKANTGFKEMYRTLQQFGAALYYIIDNANDSEYIELLNETKGNMIQVLCGIQYAVHEYNKEPYHDYKYKELCGVIGRRSLNAAEEYLIIRDYEKLLEIMLKVEDFMPKAKAQKKKKRVENIGHRKKVKH